MVSKCGGDNLYPHFPPFDIRGHVETVQPQGVCGGVVSVCGMLWVLFPHVCEPEATNYLRQCCAVGEMPRRVHRA